VQEFQEVKMFPEDGQLPEAARALMRLERDVFALWCRWLFRPSNDAAERRAREAFEAAMQTVDDALGQIGGGGPFFLGEDISMVDLLFVPFMERQNASLLYWKGFKLRNGGWANIDRCVPAVQLQGAASRASLL
jgi:glutathione S-transferase